jgi:hypothetical protein
MCCVCIYVRVCIYVYMCMYIFVMDVRMCMYVYMYVYACMCVCVCMHVYMYMCVCINAWCMYCVVFRVYICAVEYDNVCKFRCDFTGGYGRSFDQRSSMRYLVFMWYVCICAMSVYVICLYMGEWVYIAYVLLVTENPLVSMRTQAHELPFCCYPNGCDHWVAPGQQAAPEGWVSVYGW